MFDSFSFLSIVTKLKFLSINTLNYFYNYLEGVFWSFLGYYLTKILKIGRNFTGYIPNKVIIHL